MATTSTGEDKRKHLEFIQSTINRMARNSFMLKSLMALQVAAFVAFLARGSNADSSNSDTTGELALFVVLITVVPFWFLDGYFLRQERLFRQLYKYVRQLGEQRIDFSMNASRFSKSWLKEWCRSLFGVTIIAYYALIGAALFLAVFLMKQ